MNWRSRASVQMPLAGALGALAFLSAGAGAQVTKQWPIHSKERPQPRAVTPGLLAGPVAPPSDAILLLGRDLSQWRSASDDAGPAKWTVADGCVEVLPGSGDIQTRAGFGDVQLHVEFATPAVVESGGQDRGNSGIYLMGLYEIQVLDSYQNTTYPDGQAGALYGQHPPLVNASRAPGEWQSYDIIFHRPRFDEKGLVVSPARFTILHNGVLVQDNVALSGRTSHYARPPYAPHSDRLPILLQDHGNKTRFRNIWLRDLEI